METQTSTEKASKLADFAESAASEESSVRGFMNPKRGRPKGAKNKKETSEPPREANEASKSSQKETLKALIQPGVAWYSEWLVSLAEEEAVRPKPPVQEVLVETGADTVLLIVPEGIDEKWLSPVIFVGTIAMTLMTALSIRNKKIGIHNENLRRQRAANGIKEHEVHSEMN